jgi:radical SAM protein with 4Fe4S-binding SPASM domain
VDAQVVLTPGNVDLAGLARTLKAAGFRRIRFLHDTPGGEDRGGWAAADVRALMQAREEFYPYFLRSVLRGRPEVDMDFAMLVASQPGGPGGLCGCGRREVYLDTFGDLHPCPRLYGQSGVRSLGNCAEVDPAAPLPFPRSPRPRDSRCGQCWAFESCRGGCAFQCQRCALKPSARADPNQELWCDLLRAQFARAAITHRFLKRFHPGRLTSLRAIFFGGNA